jgi:hypothetical protein
MTMVELVLAGFVLLAVLYLGHPYEPLLPFNEVFWVWMAGASALSVAFWICNEARKAMKPGAGERSNLHGEVQRSP